MDADHPFPGQPHCSKGLLASSVGTLMHPTPRVPGLLLLLSAQCSSSRCLLQALNEAHTLLQGPGGWLANSLLLMGQGSNLFLLEQTLILGFHFHPVLAASPSANLLKAAS